MKSMIDFALATCLTCSSLFAMSCVASDPLVERGWTKISDDVYQATNDDGSVATRLFGETARVAQIEFLRTQRVSPREVIDDGVALHEPASGDHSVDRLSVPASVVSSGTQCVVDYSIDHRTFVVSVGPASLLVRAMSTATKSLFGPAPTILSVTHFDSGMVTPTAVADNQTPVTSSISVTQPGTMLGEPVSSSTTWLDESQFQAANLCTASATSSITVHFAIGSPCVIMQTTQFSTCVPVQ